MVIRVAVDAASLGNGKGVSRFLESFLGQVARDADAPDIEYDVFVAEGAPTSRLPRSPRIRYHPTRVSPASWWDLVGFARACRDPRAHVALTLSDRTRTSVPRVLYLFEIPDHRWRLNRVNAGAYQRLSDLVTRATFRRSVLSAQRLVVSSRGTQDDIARVYGIPRERTDVVYPAHDPQFTPGDTAGSAHFLHFSSNNDPRDNTPTVLRAFAAVRRKLPEARLMIAGVDSLRSFGWDRVFEEANVGDAVVFAGFLRGEELLRAYRQAIAYIDPSLFEGFGFQVAEAMACGAPVICSRSPCLPEVVDDAAILCDPGDVDAFAQAMLDVATDARLAASLRARGLARSRAFAWDRTASALASSLRQAAIEVR